jgi:hypothetical protein
MARKKKVVKYQYHASDDVAQWIWSNRTHRSVSEAFRDAQYACAIQTFKADWKLTIDFIVNAFYGAWVVGMAMLVPILLFIWLTK